MSDSDGDDNSSVSFNTKSIDGDWICSDAE